MRKIPILKVVKKSTPMDFPNDAHLSEDKKSVSFSESFYVELSDKRKQRTCEAKVEF